MVSVLNRVVVSAEKAVTSMLAVRVLCNFHRSIHRGAAPIDCPSAREAAAPYRCAALSLCSRRVLSKAMGARFEDVFDAVLQALKKHTEDDNLRGSSFALYINYSRPSPPPPLPTADRPPQR